ncbi:MAG TPA: hypothetical protein VG899_01535 [Mycobacteriales bacterium]|nr:hypothetical protein [Mycobacteriales bacterium]
MSSNLGPLVPADEFLTHQIVATFGSVASSDPGWTEKVWMTVHARDGSIQACFGLGKYVNRGVYDSAGGVSRGTEQWTVRASRTLSHDPNGTVAGPLRYEVVEPLRAVRAVLEPNDHAPIAFDLTWRGAVPPSLEEPWPERSPDGYRVTHDALRYHQTGVAEGWIEVDGQRSELSPETSFSVRDHSWGIRPDVGQPTPGLPRGPRAHKALVTWAPMLLHRPDGSAYSLFAFLQHREGPGLLEVRSQGEEVLADGTVTRYAAATQQLTFRDDTRRLTGGTITLLDASGRPRPLTVTPVSDTGFALGTAGYFGWNGRMLGQWAGPLVVDGEHLSGLDTPQVARQVHQLRDVLCRVEDPVGGGEGFANVETMAVGEWPDLGLSAENGMWV